jgi:hypothetical protein
MHLQEDARALLHALLCKQPTVTAYGNFCKLHVNGNSSPKSRLLNQT